LGKNLSLEKCTKCNQRNKKTKKPAHKTSCL
jgi:hypothetical protein